MSFWGIEVKGEKPSPFVPPPESAQLHLSQATLVPDAPQGAKVAVRVKVAEDEIYICSLREGGVESASLDLTFDAYAEFSVRGTEGAAVHLAGYVVTQEDEAEEVDTDEDEYEDAGSLVEGEDRERLLELLESHRNAMESSEEDSEEDDDSDTDEEALGAAKRRPKGSVIIEDITDLQNATADPSGEKMEDADPLPSENAPVEEGKRGTEAKQEKETKKASLDGNEEDIELGEVDTEDSEADSEDDDDSLSDLIAAAEDTQGEAATGPTSNGKEPRVKRKGSSKDTPVTKKAKMASPNPETKIAKKSKRQGAHADLASQSPTEGPTAAKGKKSYPNGFIIENVSIGPPNSKLAKPGKRVAVKYVGRLAKTGNVFDQTKGSKTFSFRLGVGEVIKGWDQGLMNMRVGDKRKLTVPPSMAYGERGIKPVIPANATLVFDIELCDVKG